MTSTTPGTLIGACGGYDVYLANGVYSAAGWSGRILVSTAANNKLRGTHDNDLILGLAGNDAINSGDGQPV